MTQVAVGDYIFFFINYVEIWMSFSCFFSRTQGPFRLPNFYLFIEISVKDVVVLVSLDSLPFRLTSIKSLHRIFELRY